MFESRYIIRPTISMETSELQHEYPTSGKNEEILRCKELNAHAFIAQDAGAPLIMSETLRIRPRSAIEIVDYAGLFPPARFHAGSRDQYATYKTAITRMRGRFIVPVGGSTNSWKARAILSRAPASPGNERSRGEVFLQRFANRGV